MRPHVRLLVTLDSGLEPISRSLLCTKSFDKILLDIYHTESYLSTVLVYKLNGLNRERDLNIPP